MNNKVEDITPYGTNNAKHEQVKDMFDAIAPHYDLMNRMMTMGVDKCWRRRVVNFVASLTPSRILDIATGTGDLAIAMGRKCTSATVTGVDLSPGMIECGNRKIAESGLSDRVALSVADALALPFDDNTFDVVTAAFGVRNFEKLEQGYREMARVMRPGAAIVVLELTTPTSPLVKPFYSFYTKCIIPVVGKVVSGDSRAYTYLPESIRAVPARNDMLALMRKAGLDNGKYISLTFGTCTIYIAYKPPR